MSQELDLFNLKYQRLMEALRARMAEVGEQNAGDPEIQVGQISLLQRDAETCAIAHTFAQVQPAIIFWTRLSLVLGCVWAYV